MRIAAPASATDPQWLSLRLGLWPSEEETGLRHEMADMLGRGHFVRLAYAAGGAAIGLVEASQRVDYVNGTSTSPVAFLEGLFVDPAYRRRGVARALVDEVERWAATRGCVELASDSPLENAAAHATHRALGFEETERVVYFRKSVRSA